MNSSFLTHYTRILAEAIPADFSDNYDIHRFGPLPARAGRRSLIQWTLSILARAGFLTLGSATQTMLAGILLVDQHLHDLEWLYSKLCDEESREILVKVVAFRALGCGKIKLPLNNSEHWDRIRSAERMAIGAETIPSGFMQFNLARLNLRGVGYPIEMFHYPAGIVSTFIEQQYRCVTAGGSIECADGDFAIDAGGCWGDTALYFAHKVGPHGKVASFEFLPDNVEIFERNVDLNPELSRRIRLYKNPVWSSGGEELYVSGHGPGTTVGPTAKDPNALKVQTVSIDDLVRTGDTQKVDFIKMDIEGAEMAALRGAEQTLKQFKPKLAVCVYHHFQDFWTIPQYLNQLGVGYRFYLRHFSIHTEETVLFAV